MSKRLPLLLIVFFLCQSALSPCFGQLWSGILATNRGVDWSSSGIAPGATIVNRTTACSTQPSLASGTGSAAANTTAMNAAIVADWGGNCVINLAAGTWYFSGNLCVVPVSGGCASGSQLSSEAANITIRGAGPTQTILSFLSSGSYPAKYVVLVYNNDSDYEPSPDNIANWTAGYSTGTTSITLSALYTGSHAPIVGDNLILDQCDTGLKGSNSNGTCTGTNSDNGNFFICGAANTCSLEGQVGGRANREQFQTVKITSVSGTGPYTVGISPAIYVPNFTSGQSPQAWWSTNLPVSGVGFENFSVDVSSLTTGSYAAIGFDTTTNNWVKNVSIKNNTVSGATWSHIEMYASTHITVQDSYFYGSAGVSDSYGVTCDYNSSDNLIQNNIFQKQATAIMDEQCTGTVAGYNYVVEGYYTTDTDWLIGGIDHHSGGDNFDLFEGNATPTNVADDVHGTGDFLTFYRNYLYGQNWSIAENEQTSPAEVMTYNRYYNFVANVLGNPSTQSPSTGLYQVAAASTTDAGNSTNANQSIYVLGYSHAEGTYCNGCIDGGGSLNNDTLVLSSLMRWGNWDSVTNAVRYCTASSGSPCSGNETGSGASTYPGLSNPSSTFPASFYLPSSTPSWWNFASGTTAPWPAIGPDVTGAAGCWLSTSSGCSTPTTGGHAYLIPAANCYLKVLGGYTDGTSGALTSTFDANKCYASTSASSPPPAPTNLTAIVH